MRTIALGLLLPFTLSACYQYFPLEESAPLPEPGSEVRARLSAPRALDVGSVTMDGVSIVEGDVYQTNGDTLAVFSRWLLTAYGNKHAANGAVFYLSKSDILRLEERRLVPGKAAIATGAVVGGAVAVLVLARELGGGGGGTGNGNGNDLRIVIPFPGGIRIGGHR